MANFRFSHVVKFEPYQLTARYDAAARTASEAMWEYAAKEVELYTPHATGATIDSLQVIHGNNYTALTWSTPYAGVIYKGIGRSGRHMEFSQDKSPLATAKWFDVAKKYRWKAWFAKYQEAYRKAAK